MAPRVFISYTHDTQGHMDRVWDLSEKLRGDGVDCRIDQHEESPAEGWPRWCRNQVQETQFVLIGCTETYQRRYEGKEEAGKGLGGQWEGFVITQELYEAEGKNTKFIPIVFSENDSSSIPIELRGATYYNVSEGRDYEKLFRRITSQAKRTPSAVSLVRMMPELPRTLSPGNQLLRVPPEALDVFLSHAHVDAKAVEELAARLEDEAKFHVWLDTWTLVPGEHWQQKMARGLDQARTCAVCVGQETPHGWFQDEIERALNRQRKDESFRVIPIILPGGDSNLIDNFLELRSWVDFSVGLYNQRAFHLLVSGIQGIPPGRVTPEHQTDNPLREQLLKIRDLRREELIDDAVAIDRQRALLDRYIP